jgi:hypothetical protein
MILTDNRVPPGNKNAGVSGIFCFWFYALAN